MIDFECPDMPLGIDVGRQTVHVATSQGTSRHDNVIRRASAGEGDGSLARAITVETDDGVYLVGAHDATDGDDEPVGRLFGDRSQVPAAVRGDAVRAFLAAAGDGETGGSLRYVAREGDADPLRAVATGLDHDVADLDAGMAVIYDLMDAPATGLGIAVKSDQAVATLAAAGVPVATANIDIDGDWFDFDGDASGTADGPMGDWIARQYETLFGDLATALATSAPALNGPVHAAVGGEAAPAGNTGRLADALKSALPVGVGSVTVADDPDASLARGALVAAEADDESEAPLPTFATPVSFVSDLADVRAAADAFGAGARQAVHAGSSSVGTDGNLEQAVARTRAELATLDRRGAMTARGLSDLADRMDGHGAGDVDSLRADLESLASRLPDDAALESLERDLSDELGALRETVEAIETRLESLDETTASADAVADLEASLNSLDGAVADLEHDAETIRAVIAGLDADADIDAPDVSSEGVDALRAETLQDEIEAVEAALTERIEGIWSKLDELDDSIVDLRATAGAVPDLESTVASTRDSIADLEDEIGGLRETVDSLWADLESVEEETPSVTDLQAVESDLDRVADDVESLREEIDAADWVDTATVDRFDSDLDALRQTLISRAERLETLEDTTEDLGERIETVYQNSAKSEALSSLETETARVRQTAAEAMDRTSEVTETVGDLGETVDAHDEQLGMLSTNVDNLAGSSVTRPEMEAAIDRVEDRLDEVESDVRSELNAVRSLVEETEPDVEPVEQEDNQSLVVVLQTVAFVALGVFGALLAVQQGLVLVASGFLVFSIMPGVLSWLIS